MADPRARLRIVELSDGSIAASYCGHVLSQLGCDVIKVEPPGAGDRLRRRGPFADDASGLGGLVAALNRGKRVVSLDITQRAGASLLQELLSRADILVHHLSPDVAASLGVDTATLEQSHPRLVSASVTGYGADGPYAGFRCYPINAAALGGLSVGIGRPGERPLTIPLEIGEYQAGVVAAIGILAALNAVQDVGGQGVDVSEADVWSAVHTGQNILTFLYLGVAGLRAGNHSIGQYPNSFLRCKDGFMCVNLTPLPHWLKFIEVMGTPEWTKLPRYRNRRAMTEEYPDEVDRLLEEWLMQYTKAEIFKMARDAGLPVVPALGIDEVLANEHLRARAAFEAIRLGARDYDVPRLPFLLDPRPEPPAPSVPGRPGCDTEAVLRELGIVGARLDELYELEVI